MGENNKKKSLLKYCIAVGSIAITGCVFLAGIFLGGEKLGTSLEEAKIKKLNAEADESLLHSEKIRSMDPDTYAKFKAEADSNAELKRKEYELDNYYYKKYQEANNTSNYYKNENSKLKKALARSYSDLYGLNNNIKSDDDMGV